MAGDLDGILVVALEQAVAAPYCTAMLADAGARVIKIERPEGDFARRYDKTVLGESSYFVWLNRGKQSIALDLRTEADKALLGRMIARADVFIQNFAPGAAARLGFGSADLRARQPRLIACDVSGYGEDGPYRDMKAYDLLVQAESGLSSITGGPEGPARVGVSVCDIGCGMYAHAEILRALFARARTGEGRAIEVSLFGAMAEWMTVPYLQLVYGGFETERVGLKHTSIAPYGGYPCRGGEIVVFSIQNDKEWPRFCEGVLRRPELLADARFKDMTSRFANRKALDAVIAEVFGRESRAEIAARLKAADLAYGSLSSVRDLAKHPQLRTIAWDTPGGRVNSVAPPARVRGRTLEPRPVPRLDEHGAALRREFS
jgi:crotonobetainyl-CoA:carnitine CoA-transferase CaiB-like acyl-CoA transferase